MAPLITLVAAFAALALVRRSRPGLMAEGRIALGVMLVVTGSSHFTHTASLVAMVPPPLPPADWIVYATGVAELGAAAALFVGYRPPQVGIAIAALLIAMLPANIHSALAGVGMGGHGSDYLWFRVPLQLLFIGWALYFTRPKPASVAPGAPLHHQA